jgi:tetratricopeptide (TPR) repeat protein
LQEINELVRSSSLPAVTWLQFARIYAKHAKNDSESSELSTKRALALLDKGADAGLADQTAVEEDAAFAELRDRQEFQVILNKVKSNALISSASKKLQLKDFSGCIADLDKALDLNPRNNLAFSDRGWAKHNLKDFPGALADYDRAIDADPKQDIAIVNKAFLLATVPDPSIRDGANALELADRGWQIKQSPYCLNAKSCALAAMGRFDEAIEVQTQLQSDAQWRNDDGIDGGQHSEARIDSWKTKKLWHPPYQEQNEK